MISAVRKLENQGSPKEINDTSYQCRLVKPPGMLGLAKRGNICKNGDTILSMTKLCRSRKLLIISRL